MLFFWERWKDVVGYEGFYQVSDFGRVRSVDRVVPHGSTTRKVKGRILRLTPHHQTGHLYISLHEKGIRVSGAVHRVVLEAWVGPCLDDMECCHEDGNPANNCVRNLRWDTRRENSLDKIRIGDVSCIPVCRSDGVEFYSTSDAARVTGCDSSAIRRACKGEHKNAGGFGWEFI